MYTLLVVLILIISILLGLVVLVQNSKGGGLVSNLGSANQMMGVRKTADFLEKTTWTLAGILVVLCLISSVIPKDGVSSDGVEQSSVVAGALESETSTNSAVESLPTTTEDAVQE